LQSANTIQSCAIDFKAAGLHREPADLCDHAGRQPCRRETSIKDLLWTLSPFKLRLSNATKAQP
jgi:hypothetical protein